MKRMKSRIKIGRMRAKRKMADKGKLEKRSMRKARDLIVRKLTKDIPKKDLSFARKQEIEKRLDKPAMQARIKRIARKMFPKIRKAEVERKKG
jgi:mannitol-1-phosphate/altronate dehydrogenase